MNYGGYKGKDRYIHEKDEKKKLFSSNGYDSLARWC